MKSIWVISDSEPIPEITNSGRLMRAGKFCDYARKENFSVTWWSTTWMHYERRFIYDSDTELTLSNGTTLKLLHVKKAYKKHVSIQRILYCLRMQKLFRKRIKTTKCKPDIIICSWPLIELSYESVKFGKKNGIPVVLDIRDLWPEIFTQPFTGVKKFIVKCLVAVLYGRKVRYAVKNADQIIGVTDDAVKLSNRWGRKENKSDHPLFLSSIQKHFEEKSIDKAKNKWKSFGIKKDDKVFVYVGSIHLRNAKLDIVIDTAKNTQDVKYVLCGNGPDYESLLEQCKNIPNVILPGYMNEVELYVLQQFSTAGILPYSNTPDFINALPNKLGEYLSNNLPVFTHLKGDSRSLIEKYNCGGYFCDKNDLINLVRDYSKDKKLLEESRENASRVFNEFFNADIVYKNYFAHLNDVLTNGGKL